MSQTGIRSFDSALSTANTWIAQLHKLLGYDDKQKTYLALKVTLQAIRDRLPINEAKDFAACLPLFLKAIFYEGMTPSIMPVKVKNMEQFYDLIDGRIKYILEEDATIFVPKVLEFLSSKISIGERADITDTLPEDLKELFW